MIRLRGKDPWVRTPRGFSFRDVPHVGIPCTETYGATPPNQYSAALDWVYALAHAQVTRANKEPIDAMRWAIRKSQAIILQMHQKEMIDELARLASEIKEAQNEQA